MLIVSHRHDDHINGIEKLEDINIKRIVYARDNLLGLIPDKYSFIQVVKGDELRIGKNINIKVISPSFGKILDKDIDNANSLVVKVKTKKYDVLYMGDSTVNTERYILKDIGKVDILKVGHHGSNTSTCIEFLKKINPKLCVISSEKKVHGHPHKEVLERLREINCKIKITERDGFVKLLI